MTGVCLLQVPRLTCGWCSLHGCHRPPKAGCPAAGQGWGCSCPQPCRPHDDWFLGRSNTWSGSACLHACAAADCLPALLQAPTSTGPLDAATRLMVQPALRMGACPTPARVLPTFATSSIAWASMIARLWRSQVACSAPDHVHPTVCTQRQIEGDAFSSPCHFWHSGCTEGNVGRTHQPC